MNIQIIVYINKVSLSKRNKLLIYAATTLIDPKMLCRTKEIISQNGILYTLIDMKVKNKLMTENKLVADKDCIWRGGLTTKEHNRNFGGDGNFLCLDFVSYTMYIFLKLTEYHTYDAYV